MKMSYRHRLAQNLVIAIAVSVFFAFSLTSCGIPTYWQPKNSTVITKATSSSDNEVNFNVNVNFYSGDDGSNAPKIGLVLLYVYSDTQYTSGFSTELVKQFNTAYRGTSPNGVSTLTSEADSAIWTFTVSDVTYSVYAFDGAISAPSYNKDLSSNTDISQAFRLVLNPDVDSVDLYSGETLDSTLSFGLESSNLSKLQNSSYIHVYAALSAQGQNYGNIYWSDLTYVGSFSNFKSDNN